MSSPIYGSAADNILDGAVITSTVAPSSGYPLTIFASGNPSERVLFPAATVTVTFTIGSAKAGAILVIPQHNLVGAVLTLTNGAGYSHAITPPAVQSNGFPPTLAIDLSAFAGTLTSTVWNLVIAGNPTNVVLGGAIAIYPKKTLTSVTVTNGFSWDFTERETRNIVETPNEYGSLYIQDHGTVNRQLQASTVARPAGIATILEWFRGSNGRAGFALAWPDPSVATGAYYGRWQKTIEITTLKPFGANQERSVVLLFDEASKGLVIA